MERGAGIGRFCPRCKHRRESNAVPDLICIRLGTAFLFSLCYFRKPVSVQRLHRRDSLNRSHFAPQIPLKPAKTEVLAVTENYKSLKVHTRNECFGDRIGEVAKRLHLYGQRAGLKGATIKPCIQNSLPILRHCSIRHFGLQGIIHFNNYLDE